MENVAGLIGLMLIGFAVALFLLGPDWVDLGQQVLQRGLPDTEQAATYWFYAVALFGAAMTPYEVFFFSSGAVEEGWTSKDLAPSPGSTCSSGSRSAGCCRWPSPPAARSSCCLKRSR